MWHELALISADEQDFVTTVSRNFKALMQGKQFLSFAVELEAAVGVNYVQIVLERIPAATVM